MSHEFSLEGKTALVTGASKGIGRAIALAYGRAGADVAVLARSTDALKEVSTELAEMGRRTMVLTCDVTDEAQVKRSVSAAIEELGCLDVLVNNAGGTSHAGPFLQLKGDDWTKTVSTNLHSVIYFCREVGRHMVSRGAGSVVNVSSVGGTMGVPMLSHYCSAKFAVIGLTRTLAAEWASSGVRVNALAPGWVITELTANLAADADISKALLNPVPMSRWGASEEVTGAAIYLASDAARLVTGSTFVLDGGLTSCLGGPTLLNLLTERTAM